jgi:hypothetical protein
MQTIDIFYQGHGIREIEHIEVTVDHTIAMVKAMLIEKHGCETDVIVFAEDRDGALEDHIVVLELCGPAGAKLHLHRCHHIDVAVNFAGKTVTRRFAPSATVAKVKHWAAVKEFGMTPDEAGEHVLQIAGMKDRPTPGTHIGTLGTCPACAVRFDLVPDQRVNGASA